MKFTEMTGKEFEQKIYAKAVINYTIYGMNSTRTMKHVTPEQIYVTVKCIAASGGRNLDITVNDSFKLY